MKPEEIREEPDVVFAGFRLWVFGRQFPDSRDYWDGNWVVAKAVCDSHASRVEARGSFIHLPELSAWRKALRKLHRRVEGEAELKCMEPNLSTRVVLDKRGTGTFTVHITPDHMTEAHQFTFDVDQSYLPTVVDQLTVLLKRHHVRWRFF
jgi:hypothetical protein